jgi:hypothetical protein
MRFTSSLSILLAAQLLAPLPASAQVPQLLSYQGRLLKTDGTPEIGPVSVRFSLFQSPTGGTAIWNEDQSVSLTDGFFAAYLGDASPLTGVVDGSELWLELSVGGEAMKPRQRLASAPFALTCSSAQYLKGGSVDATSISVKGTPVIDASGKWVGSPTGLVGPQGPVGVPYGWFASVDSDRSTNAGAVASKKGVIAVFQLQAPDVGYAVITAEYFLLISNVKSGAPVACFVSTGISSVQAPPANDCISDTGCVRADMPSTFSSAGTSYLGFAQSVSRNVAVAKGMNTLYLVGSNNNCADAIWGKLKMHGIFFTAASNPASNASLTVP